MTTTRKVPQVVSDLQAARDLLERKGWVQGKYYDKKGRHCLIGALRAVVHTREDDNERVVDAVEAIEDVLPLSKHMYDLRLRWRVCEWHRADVIPWNDNSGRIYKEVLQALDDAIAKQLGVPQLVEVNQG